MEILHQIKKYQTIDQNKFNTIINLILNDINYNQYNTITIKNFLGGQTQTAKKILKIDNMSFFIKLGEKVEIEKRNYNIPIFKDTKLFLPLLNKYSPYEDSIVLPFYDSQNLDDYIFHQKTNVNQIIKVINTVLRNTSINLWQKNIKNPNKDITDKVENMLMERIDYLEKNINCKINNTQINIKKIFEFDIEYTKGREKINLPNIYTMLSDVIYLFKKYRPKYQTSITGDFQPSNILIKNHQFKIIDLSECSLTGDMAMDIGKFFNFLNRFYTVSSIRDKKNNASKNNANNALKIKNNKLIINNEEKNQLQNIFEHIENNFTTNLCLSIKDFSLPNRVILFKFFTNIITLKRHLNTTLAPYLFINIADSYLEIQNKIKNI